jgi:hypothetical protein
MFTGGFVMNLTFRKKSEMAKKKAILGQMLKLNPKNNKSKEKARSKPLVV